MGEPPMGGAYQASPGFGAGPSQPLGLLTPTPNHGFHRPEPDRLTAFAQGVLFGQVSPKVSLWEDVRADWLGVLR